MSTELTAEEKELQEKNIAFLAQELTLNMKQPDGSTVNETYTIKELVHKCIRLQQGMDAVNLFTMKMAKEFYQAFPGHAFFSGCDKRFMEKLQEGDEKVNLKLAEETVLSEQEAENGKDEAVVPEEKV